MNNEEIKTPEVTPETPSAPVESAETPEAAPVAETPATDAPAAPAAPAPASAAVRAPITNPHKYFLLSNIFRAITVALMIVCVIMSLFLPVFSVNGDSEEDAVTFSVMDIIGDLPNEFKLCFTLDVEDPEDWEAIAEIYEDPGKFTLAVDATMLNLTDKDANTSPLADMVSSFYESRILTLIPYFLLLMPVIFVVALAISALIRLIQVIIGFIKPSSQIKKTDASTCIVVTIFFAVCYAAHFFYSCFTLNFVSLIILAVVSIAAVVMNIVYKKHTKEIVDAQFGL